jgi:hypothetical protein
MPRRRTASSPTTTRSPARNTEYSRVRDGRLVETNVFFGGRY